MENQLETICPSCKSMVLANAFFCPNCGKQLKEKAPDTTVPKQIIVYAVSLFLSPLGLWYVWKYLKAGDYESRKIGIIALILTLVSVIAMFWLTAGFINSVFQTMSTINNLNI